MEAGRCFSTVSETDLKQCGLSPPGFYGPAGVEECQPCPRSATFGDSGHCEPECLDTTTCVHQGKCVTTPAGYYSYEGTSQCLPCPSASTPGSTSCPLEKAAPGPACSAAGKCVIGGVCSTVPAGFYSPQGPEACIVCVGSSAGATSCPSCKPAGMCFSTIPGTNFKQCGLSPPGFYGPLNVDDCQPCKSSITFGDSGSCDPECLTATTCLYDGKC